MNWRCVAEEFALSQGGCLFNFFLREALISWPVALISARLLEIQLNSCLYIQKEVWLVGFIGLPCVSEISYTRFPPKNCSSHKRTEKEHKTTRIVVAKILQSMEWLRHFYTNFEMMGVNLVRMAGKYLGTMLQRLSHFFLLFHVGVDGVYFFFEFLAKGTRQVKQQLANFQQSQKRYSCEKSQWTSDVADEIFKLRK